MDPRIALQLDSLVLQVTALRDVFEKEISNGKSFEEVKVIHLQIKQIMRQIENYQVISLNQSSECNN